MQSTSYRRRGVILPGTRGLPSRRWRRILLAGVIFLLLLGAAFHWRATIAVRGSDVSRQVIGTNNTLRLEALYFRADDAMTRLRYRLFGGGGGTPVSLAVQGHVAANGATVPRSLRIGPVAPAVPVAPVPDAPPAAVPPVYAHTPSQGEGVWQPITLAGALRAPFSALHPISTTYLRPDPARPYATVTLAEVSAASVSLHLVAGTSEPGTALGVSGTGAIPARVLDGGALIAAFNGGFRYQDGHYGMIVDGTTVSTMKDGLATIATYRDGSFRIGIWGADIVPSPDLVSARQNAIPLVDHGVISPQIDAGGTTWGFVWYTSKNFYTTRSAIGLTPDGRLVFAEGYQVNARTFATALQQAGLRVAMQLDINTPYTQLALYEAAANSIHGFNLTSWMGQDPQNFFSGRARDFGYVTIRGK
ncbi:MAG TPA: phosphodiester glycosidase family protein [Dehalococcoidia bacterium]|nr:phosphodiester glycosidase family protein [Dehalococcoidia bacterium]